MSNKIQEKPGDKLKRNGITNKTYNLRCLHCGDVLLKKKKSEFIESKIPHVYGKYYLHSAQDIHGKTTYCGPLVIIRVNN